MENTNYEQLVKNATIMSKLKHFTYVVYDVSSKDGKIATISGVAPSFARAKEIMEKWNEKLEMEKKRTLNCVGILEGQYKVLYKVFEDCPLCVIPSRECPTKARKQTKQEMFEYYTRLCETLNLDP